MQEVAEFAAAIWPLWLMILFGGIVFWTLRPKNKAKFEDAAKIPLRDEEEGPTTGRDDGGGDTNGKS